MVDRQSRTRLVAAITRYMNEAITAFAFDEAIHQIRNTTGDATVQFVVNWLWFHYDDCKDHFAGLSKQEWDYFQRLILLLESDSQIDCVSQRRWSVRQIVAAAALLCFGLCVVRLGFGWHLFGVALGFGPISILLSSWRNHASWQRTNKRLDLLPFSSFSELRAIRKTTAGFSKKRYPAHMQVRRVHGRLVTIAVWIQTFVLWSFISPLVLLFQALPEKQAATRIREATAWPKPSEASSQSYAN